MLLDKAIWRSKGLAYVQCSDATNAQAALDGPLCKVGATSTLMRNAHSTRVSTYPRAPADRAFFNQW